ncbi:uncharacterized protein LOC114748570 [Neltuma alba]|uniref:uncharacterized protein LOC114748570 n=1 Tax=Neltuma alba TaxID=207710 RepID=UPI0010A334A4|nr:uncharacterized protein LOC114748570 [Prosopis alba]
MLRTFRCGAFHHEEEDEACRKSSDFSASPKSKNCKSHSKSGKNNNPYSTIGRDKFSALLADLDEKRQKIYSQTNPHDISFVRFVYTETDDFVPVVVKSKNKDPRKHKSEELKVRPAAPVISEPVDNNKAAIESSGVEEYSRRRSNAESDHRKAEKTRVPWNMWRRPSEYLPIVMILILVFLIVFGRSAATLCTCIVWYIMPSLPALKESSKSRKSAKKKEYVKGMNEKKKEGNELGSPTQRAKSPGRHGHRKSW